MEDSTLRSIRGGFEDPRRQACDQRANSRSRRGGFVGHIISVRQPNPSGRRLHPLNDNHTGYQGSLDPLGTSPGRSDPAGVCRRRPRRAPVHPQGHLLRGAREPVIANVAIARELAGFWSLVVSASNALPGAGPTNQSDDGRSGVTTEAPPGPHPNGASPCPLDRSRYISVVLCVRLLHQRKGHRACDGPELQRRLVVTNCGALGGRERERHGAAAPGRERQRCGRGCERAVAAGADRQARPQGQAAPRSVTRNDARREVDNGPTVSDHGKRIDLRGEFASRGNGSVSRFSSQRSGTALWCTASSSRN